jgi:hypothetical protein
MPAATRLPADVTLERLLENEFELALAIAESDDWDELHRLYAQRQANDYALETWLLRTGVHGYA